MLIFSTDKQFIAIIKKYNKMLCDLYEKVPEKSPIQKSRSKK